MQYSYSELFVSEFALPISTSSFLAVISQRSTVTTYDTQKSWVLWFRSDWCHTCPPEPFWKLPHGHLLQFYLLHLRRHFSTGRMNLPQIIHRVTEGVFVFSLVLVLLWSKEDCRRNKQKYEGKNQPHAEAILQQLDMSHMRGAEESKWCVMLRVRQWNKWQWWTTLVQWLAVLEHSNVEHNVGMASRWLGPLGVHAVLGGRIDQEYQTESGHCCGDIHLDIHGCEAWTLQARRKGKIQATQMRVLSWIQEVSRLVRMKKPSLGAYWNRDEFRIYMVKRRQQSWKQRVEAIEWRRQFLMETFQEDGLEEHPGRDGAVTSINSTLSIMHAYY